MATIISHILLVAASVPNFKFLACLNLDRSWERGWLYESFNFCECAMDLRNCLREEITAYKFDISKFGLLVNYLEPIFHRSDEDFQTILVDCTIPISYKFCANIKFSWQIFLLEE